MKITFQAVTKENYEAVINLKVADEQQYWVAPNTYTLVQAAYEVELYPLAIYKDNTLVGLLLYDFDNEIPGWSMSRLMIDKKYQNQGIGKVVLKEFLHFFRKNIQKPQYTQVFP